MLRHAYRRVDHRSLTWLNPRTAVEHLCRNPLRAMTPHQVMTWLVIALLVVLLYFLLTQLVMVNV